MGAAYYTYAGKDIFLGDIQFQTPVSVGFLSDLYSADSLALVTNVGIGTVETVQYFLSFDDLISNLFFGKGVGSITVSGILFSTCNGDIPGLAAFYSDMGGIRGSVVTISIGKYAFSGVVQSSNIDISSEGDTMAHFSLQLGMTNHTIPSVGGVGSSGGSAPGSSSSSGGGIGGGANFSASKGTNGANFSASKGTNGANFSASKGTNGANFSAGKTSF